METLHCRLIAYKHKGTLLRFEHFHFKIIKHFTKMKCFALKRLKMASTQHLVIL